MPAKTAKKPATISVKLNREQLLLIVEALDSHVYWQLSDEQYRDDGYVNEPGSDDEDSAEAIVEANKLHNLLENLAAQLEG